MFKIRPKKLLLLLFVSLFVYASAIDHVHFTAREKHIEKGGSDNIFSNGFEVPGVPVGNYSSDAVAEITDIPSIETGSHLVGSIAGSFQTDQMGQANYLIPILTGAGTAGLAPQISLNYSSGSSNGVAGVGWSLNGTTVITRCRETQELRDGAVSITPHPITWDTNDKLCLNGERLYLVTGANYWDDGSTYRTEKDQFARITYLASTDSFTIERKDGSTAFYGDTTDSAVQATDIAGSPVYVWAISRFKDNMNNYIDYTYQQFGDLEFVLTDIDYTGHIGNGTAADSSHATYNNLSFTYESVRNDKTVSYISGAKVAMTQRLASIDSFIDGTNVRTYTLAYNDSTHSGRSIMTSISECRGASCLPVTTFDWSEPQKTYQSNNTAIGSFPTGIVSSKLGDINADSRADLIFIDSSNTFKVAKANGESGFGSVVSTGIAAPTGTILNNKWHLIDYNADGLQDLMVTGASFWQIYLANSSGTNFSSSPINTNIAVTNNDDFQVVDMNGDGLADLLYGDNNGQLSVRYLQKQAGGFVFSTTQTPILLPFNPSAFPEITGLPSGLNFMEYRFKSQNSINIRTHDINGDGVADMILQSEVFHENIGGTLNVTKYKFKSNDDSNIRGGSSFVSSHWIAFINTGTNGAGSINFANEYYYLDKISDTSTNTGIKMRFADVNADGLTDIVSYQSPDWSFRLANGKGFESKQNIGAITQSTGSFNNQVTLNDCNGDGMLDILFPADFSNQPYYCRLWTGSDFSVNFQTDAYAINIDTNSNFFMDVNGDGRIDHFRIDSTGAQKIYPQKQSYLTPDKIKTITNGLEAETKIAYNPLTFSSLYLQGTGANQLNFGNNSPIFDYLSSLYVVASVTTDTPTQSDSLHTTTMQYQYKKARVQTGGRGFLGFAEIVTSIPVKSSTQTHDYLLQTHTVYSQEFPYVGLPKTVVVKQLEVAPVIPPVCTGDDSCFPEPCLPSQSNCVPFLLAPTVSTTLSETSNSFNKFTTAGKSQFAYINSTIEKTYAPNGSGILKTRVQTTSHDSFGNPLVNTVKIYSGVYDANNPSVNLLHTTTTTNTYDNLMSNWKIGLLRSTSTQVSRPGKPGVTTLMEYDYDTVTGLLSEERKQPNDGADKFLRVLHEYDNFGNEIKTISCSGVDFNNTQCAATSTLANDVPDSTNDTIIHRYNQLVFDSKGRYANQVKNSLNQTVSTINSRDIYGNPITTTDLLGTTTTNSYDIFGTAQTNYSPLGSWTYTSKKWCINLTGTTVETSCPSNAVIRVSNRASGGSLSYGFIDKLGRTISTISRSFNANDDVSTVNPDERWIVNEQYFDGLGRGVTKIEPYFYGETDGAQIPTTTTEYDRYNRVTKVTLPDGATESISYVGFVTTTTNALNQSKSETKNALGEIIQAEDNLGILLDYSYNAQGLVTDIKRTINPATASEMVELLTHNSYDKLGRKTQSNDVDTGTTTSQYNAEGEIIKVTDSLGQYVKTYRDELGRVYLTENFDSSGVKKLSTEQIYNSTTNQIIQEIEHLGADGYKRNYHYDSLKRLSGVDVTFNDTQGVGCLFGLCGFSNNLFYDKYSRTKIEQDASGKAIQNHYNAHGYLERITNADDITKQYYKINTTDKFGNISQDTKAANLVTDYTFDENRGFMTNILTTGLANNLFYNYAYDQLGNLRKRADINQNQSECFYYDSLNRLTQSARHNNFGVNCGAPPTPVEQNLISYDDKGNITNKDGQSYSYLNANSASIGSSPHQVTQKGSQVFTYDANGNNTAMTNFQSKNSTFQTRHIDYNTFNKVERLWLGNDPNNPNTESLYKYDTSRQKYARIDKEGVSEKVTYFIGNVEIEYNAGQVKYKRQLGNFAIITEQSTTTTEAYLFTDHLGSIDTITDAQGNTLQKMSFSAWGERRLPANWQAISIPTLREQLDGYTNRGYTGHEMVDAFGLINMGGRIYDAALGRVLQADPFVQDPTNTQSFNRYTYVFNNPLSYTDPSGYFSLRRLAQTLVGVGISLLLGPVGFGLISNGYFAAFIGGVISGAIFTGNLRGALVGGLTVLNAYSLGVSIKNIVQALSSKSLITEGIKGTSINQVNPVINNSASDVALRELTNQSGMNLASELGIKFTDGIAHLSGFQVAAPVTNSLIPAVLGQTIIIAGQAIVFDQLKSMSLAQLETDANEIRKAFLKGITYGDTSASTINSLVEGWNLVQSARQSVLRDIALKRFAASAIINTITVVSLATGAGELVLLARGGTTTLFRAVSKSELDDIVLNGLRATGGKTGFETGKLFATTLDDAVKFGKNNFKLDKLLGVTKPNHIIRVQVPNSVLKSSTIFTADSLTAISISAERLHLLKATALKYSPFF